MSATNITEQLTTIINQSLVSLDLPQTAEVHLEHPADKAHGDYSTNTALSLFGSLKKDSENFEYTTPRALAEALAQKIRELPQPEPAPVEKVEVAGPGFINFYLSKAFLTAKMGEIIANRAAFPVDNQKTEKRLLEHTSPNPNKAMHLGHLRNNVVGMAIGRLWEKTGHEVAYDAVDNNRGIAIAKLMWGYLKFARRDDRVITDINYWLEHQDEWYTPESSGQRPDRFMDQLYVRAAEDFADPEIEAQVRQLVVDWEAGDAANRALWQQVLDYVYQGQQMTLARLGNRWDLVWHEHEHYQEGKDIVARGLESGVFRQLEDGAIITNLEEQFGLTDTVVQKSDGTALYITQDLALTQKKMNEVQPDKAYWVIGPEQSLAMKQVFAVCEQLGIANRSQLTHIPYGYMSLKGIGKMSSRKGTVVYIDDLLDSAVERVKQVILDSGTKRSMTDEEIAVAAEIIGVGAVKYSILKVGRMQDTAFDVEESVQLNGNAGPYLQYTYVRARSILEKAAAAIGEGLETDDNGYIAKPYDTLLNVLMQSNYSPNQHENDVLRNLYIYYETIEMSSTESAPHYLANYLYETAQLFNAFYNQHTVVGNEAEAAGNLQQLSDKTKFRLAITLAVSCVIKDGLNLLGIETVEKM